MLESTILARCIGWLNCLFLGTGFLVIFSKFLSGPADGSNSEYLYTYALCIYFMTNFIDSDISENTFILWTVVLILNLLTNIYLVLCVSIPSIIVWFALTSILLLISMAREVSFLFVAVNGNYFNLTAVHMKT